MFYLPLKFSPTSSVNVETNKKYCVEQYQQFLRIFFKLIKFIIKKKKKKKKKYLNNFYFVYTLSYSHIIFYIFSS